jgi:hypothetical protein
MRIEGALSDTELRKLRHRLTAAAAANDVHATSVLQAFDAGWVLTIHLHTWDWHEPDSVRVHSYLRSPGSLDVPSPLL